MEESEPPEYGCILFLDEYVVLRVSYPFIFQGYDALFRFQAYIFLEISPLSFGLDSPHLHY